MNEAMNDLPTSYCCPYKFGWLLHCSYNKDRCGNNEERLLNEIIDFNRFQMLCRLRSSHSSLKARRKQPIINSLAAALKKLRMLNTVSDQTLKGLELITQDLTTQFTRLERMDRGQARSQQVNQLLLLILQNSKAGWIVGVGSELHARTRIWFSPIQSPIWQSRVLTVNQASPPWQQQDSDNGKKLQHLDSPANSPWPKLPALTHLKHSSRIGGRASWAWSGRFRSHLMYHRPNHDQFTAYLIVWI